MDAERAWSHAMELKLLANTELRKKFHYIRRLRKAASHATQLEELCSGDVCDARTKLEAQVQCFYLLKIFNTLISLSALKTLSFSLKLLLDKTFDFQSDTCYIT